MKVTMRNLKTLTVCVMSPTPSNIHPIFWKVLKVQTRKRIMIMSSMSWIFWALTFYIDRHRHILQCRFLHWMVLLPSNPTINIWRETRTTVAIHQTFHSETQISACWWCWSRSQGVSLGVCLENMDVTTKVRATSRSRGWHAANVATNDFYMGIHSLFSVMSEIILSD